ncbi:hypothetical protein ACTZWW_04305 [Salinarimonas sp. NSM]|uniref:hypothetical protein n=1 Tax=Salinarimonas sp. NSM TaxID=3458003 RepID=UPI0040369849
MSDRRLPTDPAALLEIVEDALLTVSEAQTRVAQALVALRRQNAERVVIGAPRLDIGSLADEPPIPPSLGARAAPEPESVSTVEGREERAAEAPQPTTGASLLEPAPVETDPTADADEDVTPYRIVFEATRETLPPPPPMPGRVPPKWKSKAEHIAHLWRTTTLDTSGIAREAGASEGGVRGTISKLGLTAEMRQAGAPYRQPGPPRRSAPVTLHPIAVPNEPPPAEPEAPPAAPVTRGDRIEHLWRTTTLGTEAIAKEAGSTPGGVRAVITKRSLTADMRPEGAPPRISGFERIRRQRAAAARPPRAPVVPEPEAPSPASPAPRVTTAPAGPLLTILDNGHVIGPTGQALANVPKPTRRVLARLAALAPDQFLDEATLCEAGPFDADRLRLALDAMRPRLKSVGVELFMPLQRHWKVRRLDGEARS